MKTLELITRTDIKLQLLYEVDEDGAWWIVRRIYPDGKVVSEKKCVEETARKLYESYKNPLPLKPEELIEETIIKINP